MRRRAACLRKISNIIQSRDRKGADPLSDARGSVSERVENYDKLSEACDYDNGIDDPAAIRASFPEK
jgi:hypothetical protein